MSIISLRLNEKEEKLLKEFSTFEGLGVSSYIKKILFERLEDEYDIRCFEEAYNNHLESGKKTYSFDEVLEELGIEL